MFKEVRKVQVYLHFVFPEKFLSNKSCRDKRDKCEKNVHNFYERMFVFTRTIYFDNVTSIFLRKTDKTLA